MPWIDLLPSLKSVGSRKLFLGLARSLNRASRKPTAHDAIEDLRLAFVETAAASRSADRQVLLAAGSVLADLAVQGWQVTAGSKKARIRQPEEMAGDQAQEKARVRRQELVKRNAQLRQPAVQKFVKAMEQGRLFRGKFTSIYSLMRDGRELANQLRRVRAGELHWSAVIDPYLEFVRSDQALCAHTGLKLMDVWRYFRHTWSNQYTSVPGRTMAFLVRDRASPFHPVVGIGAISSPVMQIRERDMWIGWHPDTFIEATKANPTPDVAQWMRGILDTAIDEIYVGDFIEDGLLTPKLLRKPTEEAITQLLEDSANQRRLHHRHVKASDHKRRNPEADDEDHWLQRSKTHLFRSKRALALATYLKARSVLQGILGEHPTAEGVSRLVSSPEGTDVVRKVVRKAKADRVGIAVADITVCGAVQPYNAILGGKLVAMLAASPEVTREYARRYADAASEIASSMAGRSITREPSLVLLGTTSLYGTGSSQYNRIKIPAERLGGKQGEFLSYEELGHSESFGTSQFSEETVDALVDLAQQSAGGQRINSIFGEGVSPKLRKVRQGLDLVGLPSDKFLRHHRKRVVYAVSMIRNLRAFLLGMEGSPSYLVPVAEGRDSSRDVSGWWADRWLLNRIKSDDVLGLVALHTLVRPIRHGARVTLPGDVDLQHELLADAT